MSVHEGDKEFKDILEKLYHGKRMEEEDWTKEELLESLVDREFVRKTYTFQSNNIRRTKNTQRTQPPQPSQPPHTYQNVLPIFIFVQPIINVYVVNPVVVPVVDPVEKLGNIVEGL
eukprot:TRINITY_DN579_c0_g2_i1.p1 TRINITY_DN579_c0_g2~~TRINITY_DN579_c0_g2_i1.p1  ORF type:complete len:116 (+),score=29.22 TRINITY_DN579_c0_g2_i1:568-915(+)